MTATKPPMAVRVRVASSPEPAAAARSASQTLPSRVTASSRTCSIGPLADAPAGHVEDALEGRHVMVVAQRAQVGERVLDLAPLVEARAADELVAQPVAQERLLDGPALGVGAVHDRDVLEPVGVVVAVVRAARQHRTRRAAAGHERLHLARDPLRLLVLAVGLEALDEHAPRVLGPQLLVLAVLVARHDRVRGVEDELRRAVVLLQLDHGRIGIVALEVEDVAQVRAAPGVDALVVVTDDGQVAMPPGELPDPQVLRPVGVLVLVDVEVAPALLVVRQHRRVPRRRGAPPR